MIGNDADGEAWEVPACFLPGADSPWSEEWTWQQLFAQLPAAAYGCDADGRVIFFNRAAVKLWGRSPEVGQDLWCGSWRIYNPDGSPLRLEECPMAATIRERRPVRDVELVIERPDGTRRRVLPYSEPVFSASGVFAGAFNLLLDISDYGAADEIRSRLASIIQSSDDAIVSKDLNGIINSWNSGAERLFGYTADEAIGRPVAMLIPEDRIDEEPEVLARLRRGETIDHYETVRRRKDGTPVSISLTVSPVFNHHGHVVGASKIARDISERKAADHSRNVLAAIVQSSDDAIIGKDLNGTITSWNRGAERIFGYTAREVIGRPGTVLIPADRLDEEPRVLSRIMRGESLEHFETVRRHKNGVLFDVSVTVSPIINAHGRVVGASKIARDISERKQAEKALMEANRRKDEFLATLAHELRNPLAPLKTSLEYLQQAGPGTSPPPQILEIMGRQVGHLVRLVDDLLELSRISRGTIALKKEFLPLGDVLQHAIEISRPLIESREHSLEISLAPEALTVLGDSVRLIQVFSNLLNNAAKFTPAKGKIWLKLERDEGQAVIRTIDTGMGIPAAKLDSIFEMFSQIRESTDVSTGGLGVGLSLARRLLEMHGGTVHAQSRGANLGSEFVVRLPLVARPVESLPAIPVAGAVGPPPRRVLLVDDNRDAVESMAILLRSLGHDVYVAYSGDEGLARAEALKPDLVLLDIGMPGMSGYDVAVALREQAWGKSLCLIALTGWGQDSDRKRTREAGFDHHLVKPVDFYTLEKAVAGLQVPTVH